MLENLPVLRFLPALIGKSITIKEEAAKAFFRLAAPFQCMFMCLAECVSLLIPWVLQRGLSSS